MRSALLLPAVLALSCGSPERPAPADGDAASATAAPYTEADVAFMQGMIVHHAQALVMTELVPGRGGSEDIGLLARRIEVTQATEIDLMRRWLERRDQRVPPAAADRHAGTHRAQMPGMLTEAELDRLAGASGREFDRLFLELMISHHQGALTMVAELLSSEGGGQEPVIFRFASDVDADQRAEIARMQNVLTALERGSR